MSHNQNAEGGGIPSLSSEVQALSAANLAVDAFLNFQETINTVVQALENHPIPKDVADLKTRMIVVEFKLNSLTATHARGADNDSFLDLDRTGPQ